MKKIRLSKELRKSVEDYFDRYRIPLRLVMRTDITVALLRVGTPEAVEVAEEILGRKISATVGQLFKERKPPVAKGPPKVSIVHQRTYNRKGRWTMPKRTEDRFQRICVGMTKDQLVTRGIPLRDITRWTKAGNIVWSTP